MHMHVSEKYILFSCNEVRDRIFKVVLFLEVFLKKCYSFCQVNRLTEYDLFVVSISIFIQLEKRKICVFDMSIWHLHGIP